MKFADISGNESVVKALVGMVDSDRVPHAIMLHEDDGGGAMAIAQAFLQYLYCQHRSNGDSCGVCSTCNKVSKLIHPDIHYIFPVNSGTSSDYLPKWRGLFLSNPYFTENELSEALEIEGKNSMIKVEEARGVLDTLVFSALERGYRSVVVYLPEKMNAEASNRLLKAVEEPPEKTEFILVTHSPDSVLQTIRSRCQLIRIAPPPGPAKSVAQGDDPELFQGLMTALLGKNLLAALDIADSLAALPSRERAKNFCAYAAERLRYVFLYQQSMDSLVRVAPQDADLLQTWATSLPKNFPQKACDALSRAKSLIDRNVNLKILFTDLADTLYTILYKQ